MIPRTVLVTGGFGFIGAHVVRDLLEDGTRVIVIDRESRGNAAEDVLSAEQLASVECVATVIPGARTLTRLLREHTVDTVVHLASPLATATEGHPKSAVDDMITPQVAVLEACRVTQAKRLVWASSAAVYGRVHDYRRLPLPDDAPHMPVTAYGAAKSFLERLSSHYTARYGLDTLGLRFPLVYGPGRRRGGGQFTTQLIEGAALGKRCVFPSADTKHDWLYVGDASRSTCMAIRGEPTPTRALTVCGQVATTREVGQMLGTWFPEADLEMLEGADDLVADFDPTAALHELGYAPAVTLRDGILATANAARQRVGLPPVR